MLTTATRSLYVTPPHNSSSPRAPVTLPFSTNGCSSAAASRRTALAFGFRSWPSKKLYLLHLVEGFHFLVFALLQPVGGHRCVRSTQWAGELKSERRDVSDCAAAVMRVLVLCATRPCGGPDAGHLPREQVDILRGRQERVVVCRCWVQCPRHLSSGIWSPDAAHMSGQRSPESRYIALRLRPAVHWPCCLVATEREGGTS